MFQILKLGIPRFDRNNKLEFGLNSKKSKSKNLPILKKKNYTVNQNNKWFLNIYIYYLPILYIEKEKSNVSMFGIWIPKFDKTISNNKFVFVCDNDCYNNL